MFDPRDHLSLAIRMASIVDDEAAQRLIINRAYYAAFLVAREYVDRAGISVTSSSGRRGGSHERVIFAIGAVPHSLAHRIRSTLFRLKRMRIDADYDLTYTDAGADVSRALRDAGRVIAWINALP